VKIAWLELLPAWVLFGWRPEKFSWCDLHALLPARQADEIGPLAPPASCLAIITVQTPTSSLLLNYFTLLPLPLSPPPHSVDFLSSLCSLET
jgi:hypothetical protein